MRNLKIALDTNCLLQILGARSKYHFLFKQFLDNKYTLCVSTEILFEYEEILRQKASASAADLFLKVIAHSRNVVRKDPYFRLHMVKQDEDDNKFIDCAFACQADYIVTNDSHFNVLKQIDWPKVAILTIQEFASQI